MVPRRIATELHQRLLEVPAVILVGPRQVGKTTLALATGERHDALYLDLESPGDRAKVSEPELYLTNHLERLVILDEVHRTPGLFPVLRGLIDRARRDLRRTGLYLLLGSASLELLKQSGETLAGRTSYLELTPFSVDEISDDTAHDQLWLRGGFPDSYLAETDAQSSRWREDFIRTYLERDIPQFGPRIASETLRRFWTMIGHNQGGQLNIAQLARNVGIDVRTAAGYVDLLVDLLLVRRLPAWHANIGKRLVKSPKVYIRDSGLLHALLTIETRENLLSHPVVGASWEGFVIENVLSCVPRGVTGHFFRTAGGAEIDLLLAWPNGRIWAIEIKRSLTPRPRRGFHAACAELKPERQIIIYPGRESYPVSGEVRAMPIDSLTRLLLDR